MIKCVLHKSFSIFLALAWFINSAYAQDQADAAQFQNWVNNNAKQPISTPPPPTPIPTRSQSIPPPPLNLAVPRPPTSPSNRVMEVAEVEEGPVVIRRNCSVLKRRPPYTFKQSQRTMLRSIPPSSLDPPSGESKLAFNALIKQNMPMSPSQVVKLHQYIDVSQRAAAIPPNVPPKPVTSTIIVNLAPGASPPAIRLAQGYVSSLVFVDSTGTPWPIASYDIGDPKATNIQWDGKSNILLIQAVAPYSDSNLVVRLVGMPTPISLILVSGQRVVDYRADIHVPGLGPDTKDLPLGSQLPDSANQLLLNVLEGVAPAGSRILKVCGCSDCLAWLLNDRVYFRTRLTVLSPGWIGRMTSPDGMIAYEIQKSPSILVSQYGEPVELKLEGF